MAPTAGNGRADGENVSSGTDGKSGTAAIADDA